ncbi:hypothetical protein GCM10009765_46860 [Fodinicola feengrottensis]|uniref:Uncharacterized protein n=1 Tax=Fodinicola feengrottensis TaxID=435914 RepID=A0ABN2HR81_9ACTN
MLVGSLLLIVAAAAVLIYGAVTSNVLLITGAIGISVVAAVLLYLGARQVRRLPARSVAEPVKKAAKTPASRSSESKTETAVLPRVPAAAPPAAHPSSAVPPAVVPPAVVPPAVVPSAKRPPVVAERGRRKPVPPEDLPFAPPPAADRSSTSGIPAQPAGKSAERSGPVGSVDPALDSPTTQLPVTPPPPALKAEPLKAEPLKAEPLKAEPAKTESAKTSQVKPPVKAPPVKVPPLKIPPVKVPVGKIPVGKGPAEKSNAAETAGKEPVERRDVLRDPDDPADEPGIEPIGTGVADEFSARDDEVFVVDGRPRFHLPTCAHLADKESEPVPVWEAFELGFTPCGGCRPVAALMAVRQ